MKDLEHFRSLVSRDARSVLCGCGQAFGAQMADDGGTSETKRDVAAAIRCIAFLGSLTKSKCAVWHDKTRLRRIGREDS